MRKNYRKIVNFSNIQGFGPSMTGVTVVTWKSLRLELPDIYDIRVLFPYFNTTAYDTKDI